MSVFDAVVEQVLGTVYERLGSASQVIEPSLLTTMYLYWMVCPAGRVTVPFQRGLLELYDEALRVTALLVSQFPRAATLPTILTVWPQDVVLSSLKVTATDVAMVQVPVDVGFPVTVIVGRVNVVVGPLLVTGV